MDCDRLKACPFFCDRMAHMPHVSEALKRIYCRGDKTQCARYQLVSAGVPVPPDLFPEDTARANDLLRQR